MTQTFTVQLHKPGQLSDDHALYPVQVTVHVDMERIALRLGQRALFNNDGVSTALKGLIRVTANK